MFRHRVAPVLALLLVLFFAQTAQAFFDPPWITPAAPMAGETVSVNIRGGICDTILEWPGYPQITREGSAVRILFYGVHWDPGNLCSYPVGQAAFPVSAFEPGDYVLTVDLAHMDFFGQPAIITIGTISFVVTGGVAASATPVPAVNLFGLLVLILTLSMTAALAWRGRGDGRLVVLLFLCMPVGVRASDDRTLVVLLTNAPGAPTSAQVVNYLKAPSRAGTPPLQAFTVASPVGGDFLIPTRATGDFRTWLDNNPNAARKKLEDLMLVTFAATDIPTALSALQADPYVAEVHETLPYQLSSVELTDFHIDPGPMPQGASQYGRGGLNIDAAWSLAGGYALIAEIDTGLYVDHPALRQFSGNTYVGGNFVPAASLDIGLTGITPNADSPNVDEARSEPIAAGACTPVNALLSPTNPGHGTHVAGLIAANGNSGQGVQGTCRHCGISMWKVSYAACNPLSTPPQVAMNFNSNAANRGHAQSIDAGAQVINLSSGASAAYAGITYCLAQRNFADCLALAYSSGRDIAVVASSGNDREDLQFPASDPRVISAGGFQQNLALWNLSPGTTTNCPYASFLPPGLECGSNYSIAFAANGYNHQEVLGSAQSVWSTTYPNRNYIDYAECGDGYPGPDWGNGVGLCTGTSMSAPQIAGVVGLLRSINPLVSSGASPATAGTIRNVLATTTVEAQAGQGWVSTLGYGVPDAAAAARKVLGKVAGATVRNRVTPLFRLYEAATRDFADTTTPQYALSLMINQVHNYVQPASGLGVESTVPGYAFPYDHDDASSTTDTYDSTPPMAPRAKVYVLTTEYSPRTEWPALIPLHLMDKTYASGKDYLLATTTAEIQAAHTAGYNLRTIQGYIYQPCTPEPTCIPPGAVKLWREYKAADNDCAVFLHNEKAAFESNGYTAACPAGSNKMIGYAYPATDSDNDGLPDGFEYVVGTNPNPGGADSDNDGSGDAAEFPMIGIPVSDPCMGGTLGASNCGADVIFRNGFNP